MSGNTFHSTFWITNASVEDKILYMNTIIMFRDFTYVNVHLQVRTKQLGYFKLTGSPIRNGSHSAKRMVACVYTKKESADKMLQLKVFITNAIQDQVQVRY